jgi:hypothetical protein
MKRWLCIAALALAPPCFAGIGHATHYITLTTDATKIDEALPWMPVSLGTPDSPVDATFWANATTDNIRFTNSDGTTEIAFYILAFDAGSEIGQILVASPGMSSSVNVTYRCYFGGTATAYAAGDTYGQYNVFDANTEAVYFPGMLLPNVVNGSDALVASGAPGTAASDFEGVTAATYASASSQYHWHAGAPVSSWPFTLESLVYKVDTGAFQEVTTLSNSADNIATNAARLIVRASHDRLYGYVYDSSSASSVALTSNYTTYAVWDHLALSRNAAVGTTTTFYDGVIDQTESTTLSSISFNRFTIGAALNSGSPVNYLDGRVAMAAVHSAARSANYIATSNAAWTDSGFITWGASTPLSAGPAGHPWFYQRR